MHWEPYITFRDSVISQSWASFLVSLAESCSSSGDFSPFLYFSFSIYTVASGSKLKVYNVSVHFFFKKRTYKIFVESKFLVNSYE